MTTLTVNRTIYLVIYCQIDCLRVSPWYGFFCVRIPQMTMAKLEQAEGLVSVIEYTTNSLVSFWTDHSHVSDMFQWEEMT